MINISNILTLTHCLIVNNNACNKIHQWFISFNLSRIVLMINNMIIINSPLVFYIKYYKCECGFIYLLCMKVLTINLKLLKQSSKNLTQALSGLQKT